MLSKLSFVPALSLALLFTSCDESDTIALHLRVNADLSGSLTSTALAPGTSQSRMQEVTEGASWKSRVDLVCSAGDFTSINQLKLADIVLSGGAGTDGFSFLRVSLPRGEKVRWAEALVPLSKDERARAALALDPSGKSKDVGETIKIEITLPSDAIGNGVTGKTRGMKASAEGNVATLLVPVDIAKTAGDPIVWHLTWQK